MKTESDGKPCLYAAWSKSTNLVHWTEPRVSTPRDLENWSKPELLRVKGPDVPREKMGRMIDPYLLGKKMNRASGAPGEGFPIY